MNTQLFSIPVEIAQFPTFPRPFFNSFTIEANHVEGDNVEKVTDDHANEFGIYATYDVEQAQKAGNKDTVLAHWLCSTDSRSNAEKLVRLFNALI